MADIASYPVLGMLQAMEMVDDMQLQEIADEIDRSGKSPIRAVVDMGALDLDSVLQIIADNLGTEVVNLEEYSVPEDAIKCMDANTAQMYSAAPVDLFGDTLRVALADPMNPMTADELGFMVNKEIQIVVADPDQIQEAIQRYYTEDSSGFDDLLTELEGSYEGNDEIESNALALDIEDTDQTDVTRLVNLYLFQAIKDRASDIHFEPFENDYKIRYRLDGSLVEMKSPPYQLAAQMSSRIKVMADLKVDERRRPQDGRIPLSLGERAVDLRVSTLPTQFGESVVLRVLDRQAQTLDIEKLGMPSSVKERVEETIAQPNGIFIVTGPTGSGKTTTMYSCLQKVNDPGSKLLTAEEPVEFDLDGIMQVSVKTGTDMTFLAALRAFLRQDPDIIMVGEMRDFDTAQISVQASLTGHLVLTTLHTNDSAGAATRLIDMGVEPFLVSSTLRSVLAQRLIRKVCTQCKESFEPTDHQLEMVGIRADQLGSGSLSYGKGCRACHRLGYSGRMGIYEVFKVSEAVADLINDRAPTLALRDKAIEEGMHTLRACGIDNILKGITTIEEVLKYT